MKRSIAILLAIAYLLSLAGCAEPNTPAPKKTNKDLAAYAISMASYPEMAPYPDEMAYVDKKTGEFDDESFSKVYDAWQADRQTRRSQPEGYADGMEGFIDASIRQLLSDSDGQNKVYSPVNVYMALAMLAEVTDGNSRQQILDLLGAESIEALRTQAGSVWSANYSNDGAFTSVLANSLWLNKDISFVQSTMDTLTERYYASSFSGEMGSDAFNKALQSWIDEQTGGLLTEQAAGLEMNADTLIALASTIYFRAKWSHEFSESRTEKGLFHYLNADGGSAECDFMHQSGTQNYYWAEGFSAVGLRLESGGTMWFLLPDEGVTVDTLLADDQTMDFLHNGADWENSKFLVVNLAVPKFDVCSDIDLSSGLKALGVTDVFDGDVSDFSPMTTDMDGIYLSKTEHAARVAIDEEGVTAAAYTVMMAAGAAMPPDEEVDFILNRPFLFAITSGDGLPTFVGVVNDPM